MDEYAKKFQLTTLPEAQNFLLNIDSGIQRKTQLVESGGTKIHDFIRSLVYSKSCDIALSRTQLFDSYQQNNPSNITKEDIQFSILTMPCDCPINYPCCENIVSGDINYIVAFPHDAEMLRKQNITTFFDLDAKLDHLESRDLIEPILGTQEGQYPERGEKLVHLYQQKSEIWKKGSRDIAIPLANFYGNKRHPM